MVSSLLHMQNNSLRTKLTWCLERCPVLVAFELYRGKPVMPYIYGGKSGCVFNQPIAAVLLVLAAL